jgi:hypothetical protein
MKCLFVIAASERGDPLGFPFRMHVVPFDAGVLPIVW